MLEALEVYQFRSRRGTPLAKLCAAGVEYGWRELERRAASNLLGGTSARARDSLRRHLQKSLERITRPCFELEWASFKLAMNALGVPSSDAALTERMFLRDRPWDRLSLLFQKFPVLAKLWRLAIGQWHGHVLEILDRVRKDGPALSRISFRKSSTGAIVNLRLGLSDPHNGGRSVTLIEFGTGHRVIYKPRSGKNESAWFSLLAWMNRNGFQPKLRIARVLPREGYCWMEHIEPASCKNNAAARRFYQRIGGLVAAAYLLKAVDCHRDNLIAAGEHPVLVDVDALWQVSSLTKTQSVSDILYRTGFFPNASPRSLQSRSSALGSGTTGNHLPRLGGKPLIPADYKPEIVRGFVRAWRCILGAANRRNAFARRLRRIRSKERRWIYWATEKYVAIREASIHAGSLRSAVERDLLIRRLCTRDIVPSVVIDAEVHALKQFDIPYFTRRTNERVPSDELPVPRELIKAIQRALPEPC